MKEAPKIELSDSQREEIYKTIGYDEVVADVEMPKDVCDLLSMRFFINLNAVRASSGQLGNKGYFLPT